MFAVHAAVCFKQTQGSRIDREDFILMIQDDQSFVNRRSDGFEFFLLLMKLIELIADLIVLAINPRQKGSDLFIALILERMIKIEMIERFNNSPGQPL